MLLVLLLSATALAIGPVVLSAIRIDGVALRALDMFVLVTISGLAAFHVLPEAIEQCGSRAVVAGALGFGALTALERLPRRTLAFVSANHLGIFAVGVHALLDGAALGFSAGPFLAAATVVHRLPEGIVVWTLARPNESRRRAIAMVVALIGVNVAGAFVGAAVAPVLQSEGLVLVQAFAMGTLVHVLFDRRRDDRQHRDWRSGAPMLIGALLGVAAVALVTFVAPDHAVPGSNIVFVRVVLGLTFVAMLVWFARDEARRPGAEARAR